MLVSYIVTVFNKSRYLPFVIEGLRRQKGDFEREFIFVDDGSSDGSADLVRQLAADLPNMTVIKQPNQGPSVATNIGFAAAKGDYIKPVDGDDVLYPWATRALLDAQAKLGCKVSYANYSRAGLYDDSLPDPALVLDNGNRRAGPALIHDSLLREIMVSCLMTPTSWLARTDIVRQTGGCNENVYIQDYGLNIRLAQLGPIAELQESIFMMPSSMDGRLSGDTAQQRHDEAMILASFLEEQPQIDEDFRKFVFVLALKKLWHWRNSQGARKWFCREYWRCRMARLGFSSIDPRYIEHGCRLLRKKTPIKQPGSLNCVPKQRHP